MKEIEVLYEYRKLYHAAWCNILFRLNNGIQVYKSKHHSNGELCFDGKWFIVITELPTGQISNHYKLDDWNLFKIPVVDIPPKPFDGHDCQDVFKRLKHYIENDCNVQFVCIESKLVPRPFAKEINEIENELAQIFELNPTNDDIYEFEFHTSSGNDYLIRWRYVVKNNWVLYEITKPTTQIKI